MAKRVGGWAGGYKLQTAGGDVVFYIEKRIDGVSFHVSTRCTSEEAARVHFRRFMKNPTAYSPSGAAPALEGDAVTLDAALILKYREYQLSDANGETPVSPAWADEMEARLKDWLERLGSTRDLRTLSLHKDLKPALASWPTMRGARIKAIKGLFRWLKEETGKIEPGQDPTVALKVPQVAPEKWKRRKAMKLEHVRAVLTELEQPTRDVLHLQSATGWHLSEVRRLVKEGELLDPPKGHATVKGVLIVRHKSGETARTSLSHAEHVETARRLLALRDKPTGKNGKAKGLPDRTWLAKQMRRAIEKANAKLIASGSEDRVPSFGLGVIRHSFATWAYESGTPVEVLAEFLGHKSKATTKRFYVDLGVPQALVMAPKL